jgi:hypothetical protein
VASQMMIRSVRVSSPDLGIATSEQVADRDIGGSATGGRGQTSGLDLKPDEGPPMG